MARGRPPCESVRSFIWALHLKEPGTIRPSCVDLNWRTGSQNVTSTARRRSSLGLLVKTVFDEFRRTYDAAASRGSSTTAGMRAVSAWSADLVREQGLVAIQPRRYRVTITGGGDV